MFFRDPGGDAGPGLWTVDIWGRNEQQIKTELVMRPTRTGARCGARMPFANRRPGVADILYVMATELEYGPELRSRITPLITGVGPVEAALRR